MITGATELRVGNIIWDETKNHVKFVNHRVISDLESSNNPLPYSYIRLTKEILEVNCGFQQNDGNNFYMPNGFCVNMVIVELSPDKESTRMDNWKTGFIIPLNMQYFSGVPFYHLHELQNGYRFFAGKELEIIKSNEIKK